MKITLLKVCTVLWGNTYPGGGVKGGVWPTSHLPHHQHPATSGSSFPSEVLARGSLGNIQGLLYLWFFWPGHKWQPHPTGWHTGCSRNALLPLTSVCLLVTLFVLLQSGLQPPNGLSNVELHSIRGSLVDNLGTFFPMEVCPWPWLAWCGFGVSVQTWRSLSVWGCTECLMSSTTPCFFS